ncbi:MAG TPA: tetratricopeptide repeat protein [Candidatus Didemnitutus sp.]|nr:tetratricopeptide repeat protein [Candidatus Didemnitutus sp.]
MSPRIILLLSLAFVTALRLSAADPSPIDRAGELVRAGEFVQAEDILEPMVKGRHADPKALFYMSRVRLAQKQYSEAIDFAERAAKGDDTRPEFYVNLGEICFAAIPSFDPLEGNSVAVKMRKSYERALKLDPRNSAALTGLITFYEHAPEVVGGDVRKAFDYARRLAEVNPYAGEFQLGRLSAGAKDYKNALIHYDAAVKLQPEDMATATACGYSLYYLGRKSEARERFEAVLRAHPDFAPAKLGLDQIAADEAEQAKKDAGKKNAGKP